MHTQSFTNPQFLKIGLTHKNVPSGVANCRNVPLCRRVRRGSRVHFPREERCVESPPTFICGKRRKNRRKPVKKKIPSLGVVFAFEEGISTSHVCLKGQQPYFLELWKLCYLNFYFFLFFGVLILLMYFTDIDILLWPYRAGTSTLELHGLYKQ